MAGTRWPIRMGSVGTGLVATVALALVVGQENGATTGRPGSTVVEPAGAVEDVTSHPGLAGYQRQRPAWHGCQRDTTDEAGAELDRAGARCAEIVVPLDYARPGGRTISVAVSRLPATDPAGRLGVLLLNTGGPGSPGRSDVLPVRDWMGSVGSRFDLIGMDPRFVGESTPIDCDWPTGTWTRSAGATRAGFDRMVTFARDLAARCERRHPDVLPYATTRNTARDMDLIRAVLGESTLSYLGYSYGTYLGAVYAQMFPQRAGRMVLDSAIDPAGYGPTLLRQAGLANEAGLRDWARWAARHHHRYGLGQTQAAVLATVDRIQRAAAHSPLRVGGYQVDEHLLPVLLFNGLGDDRDEPNGVLAGTVEVLARAASGEPGTPTPALADTLRFMLTGAESRHGSVQAAILCGDVAAPRNPDHYWAEIRRSRAAEPRFGGLTRNIGPCAFWPAAPRERPTRIDNDVPVLIVASTGDTRTSYQDGQAMHRALAGSRLLTLHGARIHAVYGNYGNACVDDTVNDYLRDGVLPGADPDCRKPEPGSGRPIH